MIINQRSLKLVLCVSLLLAIVDPCLSQEALGNKPERLEWLKDAGLGLFIHWGVDSQIGTVISHSLVGASQDYADRFFTQFPQTFNPTRFDPGEWARLAKIAGFKYVVFTTKHHSGFCMFHTDSHAFNIKNTPFKRDITKEVIDAFRKEGIATGYYFSPDDFYVLYKQGKQISRDAKEAWPKNNAELMAINQKQVKELFTNTVRSMSFSSMDPRGTFGSDLASFSRTVLSRAGFWKHLRSPHPPVKSLPPDILDEPWEACFTMGTSWQFKPTNETYLSGEEWINALIETRAKGGTMLLNIGPEPNGEIPQEQEDILRELGAWMFINSEAIYAGPPMEDIKRRQYLVHKKEGRRYGLCFCNTSELGMGQKNGNSSQIHTGDR